MMCHVQGRGTTHQEKRPWRCHLAAHCGADNWGATQSEIKVTSMNSQPMDGNHKPCPECLCFPMITIDKNDIANSKTDAGKPRT